MKTLLGFWYVTNAVLAVVGISISFCIFVVGLPLWTGITVGYGAAIKVHIWLLDKIKLKERYHVG